MAQESRLVIVIDSQNAVRNAKALADEMSKITEKGDSATRTSCIGIVFFMLCYNITPS
ncbi:hypothetical protein [Acinetobacter baumannii]